MQEDLRNRERMSQVAKGLLNFETLKNEARNSGMFISEADEKRMEGLVSSADKK